MLNRRDSALMLTVTCHHCQATFLVGPRSIQSLHPTSTGHTAYVTCPYGHHVVVEFTRPARRREHLAGTEADEATAA